MDYFLLHTLFASITQKKELKQILTVLKQLFSSVIINNQLHKIFIAACASHILQKADNSFGI